MSAVRSLGLHVTEMVRSFDPRVHCVVTEARAGDRIEIILCRDGRSARLTLTQEDAVRFFSSLRRKTAIRHRIVRLLEALDTAA